MTVKTEVCVYMLQVELELADRELSLCVSPMRATIIYRFQDQGISTILPKYRKANKHNSSIDVWTVDNLSTALESQPSVVRRHLGFWVSQGVLKEQSPDVFTVVERLQEGTRTLPQGMCTCVHYY